MYRAGLFVTIALLISSPALSAQSSRSSATWDATWDLVGTGFEGGPRTAVLSTQRRGEECNRQDDGPPGTLLSSAFSRDSLFIVWDLGGGEQMLVDLQLEDDHLACSWRIGSQRGEVIGARRP